MRDRKPRTITGEKNLFDLYLWFVISPLRVELQFSAQMFPVVALLVGFNRHRNHYPKCLNQRQPVSPDIPRSGQVRVSQSGFHKHPPVQFMFECLRAKVVVVQEVSEKFFCRFVLV